MDHLRCPICGNGDPAEIEVIRMVEFDRDILHCGVCSDFYHSEEFNNKTREYARLLWERS